MGTTANYLLPYPESGEAADVPTDMHELAEAVDSKMKTATDALDARLDVIEATAGAGKFETGDLCTSMRTSKTGWLLCDGSPYNTSTYAALYAILGSSNLPDFRERAIVGVGGAGYTLGAGGGEAAHTLTLAEMPAHGHDIGVYDGATRATTVVGGVTGGGQDLRWTNPQGGGQAHNNMPPYRAVNVFIKT